MGPGMLDGLTEAIIFAVIVIALIALVAGGFVFWILGHVHLSLGWISR